MKAILIATLLAFPLVLLAPGAGAVSCYQEEPVPGAPAGAYADTSYATVQVGSARVSCEYELRAPNCYHAGTVPGAVFGSYGNADHITIVVAEQAIRCEYGHILP